MWNENGAHAMPDSRAIQCGSPSCPGIQRKWESLKEVHKTWGLLPANLKIFNKPNILAEILQHNTKTWDFVVHTRAFPSSVGKQILCLSILSQQAGRRTGLYKKDSMPNENTYGASVSKQLNVHHENRLQPYGFPLDLFSCLLCSVVKCQLIEEIFLLVSVVRGLLFLFSWSSIVYYIFLTA